MAGIDMTYTNWSEVWLSLGLQYGKSSERKPSNDELVFKQVFGALGAAEDTKEHTQDTKAMGHLCVNCAYFNSLLCPRNHLPTFLELIFALKTLLPYNFLYNFVQKQNRACFNQNINNKSVTWGKMLIIFDRRNIHYHLFYISYVHTEDLFVMNATNVSFLSVNERCLWALWTFLIYSHPFT